MPYGLSEIETNMNCSTSTAYWTHLTHIIAMFNVYGFLRFGRRRRWFFRKLSLTITLLMLDEKEWKLMMARWQAKQSSVSRLSEKRETLKRFILKPYGARKQLVNLQQFNDRWNYFIISSHSFFFDISDFRKKIIINFFVASIAFFNFF